MAVFSFTATSYDVDEQTGPALKVVELDGCNLTFSIDVTVETVGGGSATGIVGAIVYNIYHKKWIMSSFNVCCLY